ncbi:hypothetical protein Val02_45010 [Virgisporangium aliadipatigenens]|uniref:HTH luxR-type domain-containing protein n=1 Tax=Virgisporangium aliadipatigenens TaxID=741659 RepID=A0A8J3YPF9_9ACTN|nr:hypothetical protein Val02_45010 [Virgisporangium aliadipatigenens]
MAGEAAAIGRRAERERCREAFAALAGGRGAVLAFAGEPGIGKSHLVAAVGAEARRSGVPTFAWSGDGVPERVPDDTDPGRASTGGKVSWRELVPTVRALSGRPVVVLLDDLHRLPAAHAYVVEELARLRSVLVVLAYRPRQLKAGLRRALRDVECFRLGPFTPGEARQLLGDRADLDRVYAEGAGNPRYMRALADGVGTALLEEFAALPAEWARVARVAAAFQEPFSPELLTAVAGDAEVTAAAVDAMLAADLVRPVATAPLLDLRHPVLARVLYAAVPEAERRTLHRAIERELARRGAAAARRAPHVLRAPDPERPDHCTTLVEAARETVDVDPRTAAEWLTTARTLVPPNDPRWAQAQLLLSHANLLLGRFAASPVPQKDVPQKETTLHEELADLAIDTMDYVTGAQHAVIAAETARAAGDATAEAGALGLAALSYGHQLRLEPARAAADQAARLLDAASDAAALRHLSAAHRVGAAEALLGLLPEAERHLLRAVTLTRHSGRPDRLPSVLRTLGEVQLRVGRLDAALDTLDEADRLAGRYNSLDVHTVVAVLRSSALLWRSRRDEGGAVVAAATRAAATCEGMPWAWAIDSRCGLAEVLLHSGEPAPAGELLISAGGGDRLPRLAPWRRVRAWETLTAAALARGDLRAAERFAGMAAAHVDRVPSGTRLAYARRAVARVRVARRDLAGAVRDGQRAADAFTERRMPVEAAWTLVVLAGQCLDAGYPTGVAQWLDTADTLAGRCGALRLRDEVAALRRRLALLGPEPGGRLATLTAREVEVATLASTGLSSSEIAGKLYLSVRTVDSHLGRIYRKVGVSTRVALAAVVLNSQRP